MTERAGEPALRHRCTSCGGSCQGVHIRMVGEDEAEHIEKMSRALGVDRPIEEGRLRQSQDGRCVFLSDDNLCRIHTAHGAQAKPLICRQYPLVMLQTESGPRSGIDPGCYSVYATRISGDPFPTMDTVARSKVQYPPPIAEMEHALIGLLSMPGQSIEGAIAALAGLPGPALPPGFSERLVKALQSEGVTQACRHPSAGPSVRAGLAPMLAALPQWASEGTPETAGSDDLQQWGLEVCRRTLWLRLCPRLPSPMAAALIILCGALVARWVNAGQDDAYAQTLAAWSRAMRSPMFWGSLLPEAAAAQWLLRGDEA